MVLSLRALRRPARERNMRRVDITKQLANSRLRARSKAGRVTAVRTPPAPARPRCQHHPGCAADARHHHALRRRLLHDFDADPCAGRTEAAHLWLGISVISLSVFRISMSQNLYIRSCGHEPPRRGSRAHSPRPQSCSISATFSTACPANLSGGERQRVRSAARCFRSHGCLLLYEPLGSARRYPQFRDLPIWCELRDEGHPMVPMSARAHELSSSPRKS